jgi:hypothetical protein
MALIPVCPAALPKLSRLALTPVGNDTPFSTWLSFTSFDPGVTQELLSLGDNVNTGTLSPLEAQHRLNRIFVDPQYSGQPVPAEWDDLLPWITDGTRTGAGTNASPYVYPLGNTLSKRYMLFDDTQRTWTLMEVGIDSCTISASVDDPAVKCNLNLIGVQYTTPGAVFPALTPPNTAPFIASDSCATGLTVNGIQVKAESVSISLSKNVARDRFFNCPTIACAVSQSRSTRISLGGVPYGLHNTLWNLGGAAFVPVVVSWTFGVYQLTATMPRVRRAPQSVGATVPREMMTTWDGEALASNAGNDEISFSLKVSA